jgi:fatty acid desaturase
VFRYREDRLPIFLFVTYFAADVVVYFKVHSIWLLALWFGIGIIPKGCICAWNHHHQHVMTFRWPILNRLLEIVYGFQTGITSNAWVLHHVLGHHLNYLDQTKDESRWKRDDGSRMGELEYALVVGATAYPRAFGVGLRHPREMRTFLLMWIPQLAILGAALWHDWLNAVFVFVLPMITGLFLTAWATFEHHGGLDTTDPYAGSRNILQPLYNVVTGNLGYHTAHHLRAGLHWSRLPQFHAQIAPKIPKELYLPAAFPWAQLGGKHEPLDRMPAGVVMPEQG